MKTFLKRYIFSYAKYFHFFVFGTSYLLYLREQTSFDCLSVYQVRVV